MAGLVGQHGYQVILFWIDVLDRAHVVAQQAPIVLDQMRNGDRRGRADGGAGAADIPYPHERGNEDQGVGGDVRRQRPRRLAISPQATVLVCGLPVCLQHEVADHVADGQDREEFDPRHVARGYTFAASTSDCASLLSRVEENATDAVGHAGRLLASLRLDGEASDHLIPAATNVGDLDDLRIAA
jgi:hypothetical protein